MLLPNNIKQTLMPMVLAFLLIPLWMQAAQGNKYIDSLHSAYKLSNDPGQKFKALEKLARQYVTYNPDSSLYFSKKGLMLGRKNKNTGMQVDAHVFISEAFFAKRLIDSSKSHYQKAIAVSIQNHNLPSECTAYRRFADFYERIGKRDSALFCLMKAHNLSLQSGDNIEIASCLNSIGTFHKRQGDFEKALDYSRKSLKLWEQVNEKNTGGILSDIGNIYFQQQKPVEALKYYQAAYKVLKASNDYHGLGYSLNNIGLVYLVQKNYKEALNNFLQSLHNYELAMNKEGIANINKSLGVVSYELGDYPLAKQYGERALKLAKEINNKQLIYNISSMLAEAYGKAGDYKKAFYYQQYYSLYKDSAQSADMLQKVAEMQSRFEMTAKDAENKALRADKERQHVLFQRQKHWALFISIVLAMVIVISFLMFRTSRHRKKSLIKLREQNNTIEAKNMELATLNVKILAQKEQLEEASQFKDKLLSIVSHDFRSPLNSLQGFLMILSSDDLPKETVRTLSLSLLEKVKTTSEFLDNLLGWAHSQLEGYKPSARNVNLQLAAEEIIMLFKAQADAKGVTVYNKVNEDCEISADLNMVKLVLRNLISNAIKYTSAGGIITVNCEENDGEEIVTVEDTGRGISLEDQKKLFSQQGYTTPGTANEKGTGLGLTLSKEFVERNGGQIWVNSTPGKGSIFSFSIPSVQAQKKRITEAGLEMAG